MMGAFDGVDRGVTRKRVTILWRAASAARSSKREPGRKDAITLAYGWQKFVGGLAAYWRARLLRRYRLPEHAAAPTNCVTLLATMPTCGPVMDFAQRMTTG